MVRATIDNVIQLGTEVTPGTAVAATRRLTTLSLSPKDRNESKPVRAAGRRFNQRHTPIKRWTEYSGEGDFNYNEAPYIFASLINYAAPTAYSGGDTGAIGWAFTPSNFAENTYKTYTIERGYPGSTGERTAYGVFTGAELKFSRSEIGWASADMIARNLLYPFTVTSSGVTDIADETAEPGDLNVYMDSTSGGLGTTLLETVYEGAWRLKGRRGAAWTVNRANPSWKHLPGLAPVAEFDLRVEDDSLAQTLMDAFDTQVTKFVRFDALGPLIAGTKYYKMQIDMALKVQSYGDPEDFEGVDTRMFKFSQVHDSTWGKPFTIALDNAQAALV